MLQPSQSNQGIVFMEPPWLSVHCYRVLVEDCLGSHSAYNAFTALSQCSQCADGMLKIMYKHGRDTETSQRTPYYLIYGIILEVVFRTPQH